MTCCDHTSWTWSLWLPSPTLQYRFRAEPVPICFIRPNFRPSLFSLVKKPFSLVFDCCSNIDTFPRENESSVCTVFSLFSFHAQPKSFVRSWLVFMIYTLFCELPPFFAKNSVRRFSKIVYNKIGSFFNESWKAKSTFPILLSNPLNANKRFKDRNNG